MMVKCRFLFGAIIFFLMHEKSLFLNIFVRGEKLKLNNTQLTQKVTLNENGMTIVNHAISFFIS